MPLDGAVEGSRTPTSIRTLDPEPSASTNSATTAEESGIDDRRKGVKMQSLSRIVRVSTEEDHADFSECNEEDNPEQPLFDFFRRPQFGLLERRLPLIEEGLHSLKFLIAHQPHFTFKGRKVDGKRLGPFRIGR